VRQRARRRRHRRQLTQIHGLADLLADLVEAREREQVLDEHAHPRRLVSMRVIAFATSCDCAAAPMRKSSA